jgi:hypothetical protein
MKMSNLFRATLVSMAFLAVVPQMWAGNPDRAGEAGAYELVMNGWGRTSGVFGMNSACVQGLEAMRLNPAGLAFAPKTEVLFSRTHWLQGSEVYLNSAGIAQKFGKDKGNVVGVTINALDFGDIERTTTNLPEGGIGTFKPGFLNIGVGYSRAFSNSIYAGVVFRLINERIDDLSATGFCIDAGIQYVTGARENIHFGIALRNVGTPMRFGGDGLNFSGSATEGSYTITQSQRTQKFELPSQLNIGAAYDWYIDKAKENPDHKLTFMANFTSNSFGKDQFGGGLEYGWRKMLMIRAGYRYEDGITSFSTSTTAFTGLAAGMSVQVPLTKKKNEGATIGVDYAYRATYTFKGTHTYGIRITL